MYGGREEGMRLAVCKIKGSLGVIFVFWPVCFVACGVVAMSLKKSHDLPEEPSLSLSFFISLSCFLSLSFTVLYYNISFTLYTIHRERHGVKETSGERRRTSLCFSNCGLAIHAIKAYLNLNLTEGKMERGREDS
jgi:hypothetical protein